MNSLPFEKQFAHSMFCWQLQNIKIVGVASPTENRAKQLLVDLHLIYLAQQTTIDSLTTQDAFNDLN
jgi:glutamate racemase